MNCPKCNGEMWDERKGKFWGDGKTKTGKNKPIFKCKDKECVGVIWPPKTNGDEYDQRSPTEQRRPGPGSSVPLSQPRAVPDPLDARQRAIIRQHSQSMSLIVLDLKQKLGELTVEDLTPTKLRMLADYFDADAIGAAIPE